MTRASKLWVCCLLYLLNLLYLLSTLCLLCWLSLLLSLPLRLTLLQRDMSSSKHDSPRWTVKTSLHPLDGDPLSG